jgi:hypothetical protein
LSLKEKIISTSESITYDMGLILAKIPPKIGKLE